MRHTSSLHPLRSHLPLFILLLFLAASSATSAFSASSAAVPVSALLDDDGTVWLSGRQYRTITNLPASAPSDAATATATATHYAQYTDTGSGTGSGTSTGTNSDSECEAALIPPTSGTFWVYVSACLCLLLAGGLISGLTIGLFSLSNLELEVLQEDMEADAADRRRAKRLKPLLKEERHHLLLVTLLLTNTAAMEALPEMLDKLVPEWAAVLISVSLVLLFSEIIPQSICTRAPLAIGAFFSPLVWVLMLVLLPVSWPIAKLLDLCIGKEGGTQFLASRSQVTSLLEIIKRHNVLTDDEAKIMQTVVQLRNKQIRDVMIPPQDIYMLNMDDVLNAAKLHEILQAGHSRVPCYRGTSRNNIQGVLLTKRLIVCRPEDEDRVSKYADFKPVWVKPSTDIFSLLDEFQSGRSHLAIVSDHLHDVAMAYHSGLDLSASTEVCGLVTFEDLIEAVLATSIADEFDSADRMADGTVVESHIPGSRRSAAQRRIVDPKLAKQSTLNSMLKNLNILAESKGYTKQGQPQPKQRIPLKRSMTSAHLTKGGKKTKADPSPALVPREGDRVQREREKAKSTAAAAAKGRGSTAKAGKKSVRMAVEEKEVADGAYARLDALDEEDESEVAAELHTPLSGIVVASAESLSAQPSVTASRSRSEATYSSDMAVYTPAGRLSRRREFFPANDTPVLVEETMGDGSVRVMIAHDTMAAVQHMHQQAEQQRHSDEAHTTHTQNVARAQRKRDEDTPDLDPISSFASKLLDSMHKDKEHESVSDEHATHEAEHTKQHEGEAKGHGDRDAHTSGSAHSGGGGSGRGSKRDSGDSGQGSGSGSGSDGSSDGDSEDEMPQGHRMTGLPAILGMPDRQ